MNKNKIYGYIKDLLARSDPFLEKYNIKAKQNENRKFFIIEIPDIYKKHNNFKEHLTVDEFFMPSKYNNNFGLAIAHFTKQENNLITHIYINEFGKILATKTKNTISGIDKITHESILRRATPYIKLFLELYNRMIDEYTNNISKLSKVTKELNSILIDTSKNKKEYLEMLNNRILLLEKVIRYSDNATYRSEYKLALQIKQNVLRLLTKASNEIYDVNLSLGTKNKKCFKYNKKNMPANELISTINKKVKNLWEIVNSSKENNFDTINSEIYELKNMLTNLALSFPGTNKKYLIKKNQTIENVLARILERFWKAVKVWDIKSIIKIYPYVSKIVVENIREAIAKNSFKKLNILSLHKLLFKTYKNYRLATNFYRQPPYHHNEESGMSYNILFKLAFFNDIESFTELLDFGFSANVPAFLSKRIPFSILKLLLIYEKNDFIKALMARNVIVDCTQDKRTISSRVGNNHKPFDLKKSFIDIANMPNFTDLHFACLLPTDHNKEIYRYIEKNTIIENFIKTIGGLIFMSKAPTLMFAKHPGNSGVFVYNDFIDGITKSMATKKRLFKKGDATSLFIFIKNKKIYSIFNKLLGTLRKRIKDFNVKKLIEIANTFITKFKKDNLELNSLQYYYSVWVTLTVINKPTLFLQKNMLGFFGKAISLFKQHEDKESIIKALELSKLFIGNSKPTAKKELLSSPQFKEYMKVVIDTAPVIKDLRSNYQDKLTL